MMNGWDQDYDTIFIKTNTLNDPTLEKMITDIALKTIENDLQGEDVSKLTNSHLFDIVMKNKQRDRSKSTGSLNSKFSLITIRI